MALVECTECAREISDKAPTCVHCGAPNTSRQPLEVAPKAAGESKESADLARKPQQWLFAVVFGVAAWWTGGYGFGPIGRSNCDYAAFNPAQASSFENAFVCLNTLQQKYYSNLNSIPGAQNPYPGPYFPTMVFAIVMLAVSFGLWSLTWRAVRKARAAR